MVPAAPATQIDLPAGGAVRTPMAGSHWPEGQLSPTGAAEARKIGTTNYGFNKVLKRFA